MNGIYVTKGMKLSLSQLSISIDEAGNPSITGPTVSLAYDACIAWAKIALDHRAAARENKAVRMSAWAAGDDEEAKSSGLEAEFASSMQAIVAAATCIEALYDQIAPYCPVSAETKEAWRKKGTARPAQVAESIRCTFNLSQAEFAKAKDRLEKLYMLRDTSVHPPSAVQPPQVHPDLNLATDWRFVTFRSDVADVVVCSVINTLFDITERPNFRSKGLASFVGDLRQKLEGILPDGRPKSHLETVTFPLPPRGNANRAVE